jgi:hypothetical protein
MTVRLRQWLKFSPRRRHRFLPGPRHGYWMESRAVFARRSRLRLTAAPNRQRPDEWQIQMQQQYEPTSPGLIRLNRIATPGVTEQAGR